MIGFHSRQSLIIGAAILTIMYSQSAGAHDRTPQNICGSNAGGPPIATRDVPVTCDGPTMKRTIRLHGNPGQDGSSISKERYLEYLRAFSRRDEQYWTLYDPKVVFEHSPQFGNLNGAQAIVDFYRKLWREVDETVVPGDVVVDNRRGLIIAELYTRLTAKKDGVVIGSAKLDQGDTFYVPGYVIYSIRNGKIGWIR